MRHDCLCVGKGSGKRADNAEEDDMGLTPQLTELSKKLLCVDFQLSGGLYTA